MGHHRRPAGISFEFHLVVICLRQSILEHRLSSGPQTCYVAQVPLSPWHFFLHLGFKGCATALSCGCSWLQARPPLLVHVFVCLFVLSFGCSELRALSVLEAQRAGHLVDIKLAPLSWGPNLISISASSTGWRLWCQPGLLRSRASCPGVANPPATFPYLSALGGFFPLWRSIRCVAEETNNSLAKLFIYLLLLARPSLQKNSQRLGHCRPGLHSRFNEDPAPVGWLA